MKKSLLILSLLFLVFPQVMAGDRTEQQMKEAAAKVLNNNARRAVSSSELKELKSLPKLKIYGYDQGGFAVVTTDDRFDEVIGYSTTKCSEEMPCGFKWWLETAEKVMENANDLELVKHHKKNNRAGGTSISPMMTTRWGQGRPFYDDCTFTYNGSTYQCVTGCVATAMAQVMNYHKYPDRGTGSNSYTVTYNDSFTITYSKDFSQSSYDWNNMLDDYSSYSWNNLKDEHTIAVANLMSDCGVSVNMTYSDVNTGSSAEMEKVETALEQFFLYRKSTNIYYRAKCSDEWMELIYNELKAGRPIIYSGASLNEAGHAFVIHGYDASTEQVYVNWGWDGRYDGYYNIDMLNPDVYQYNNFQSMVMAVPETGQSYTTYDLGITASGNGTVSYNGDAIKNSTKTYTLDEGSSVTLTFLPDNGYMIKSVSVNGVDVTSKINFDKYTINRLNNNTTVTVVFEAIPPTYGLTIRATGNGIVTYGDNSIRDNTYFGFISGGSSVTLIILPDNEYRIKKVTNNGTDVTSEIYNNQYIISSINGHTEINVVFEAIPTTNYNLTITAAGNGSITYGTSSIRDNTSSFSVEEGSGATLIITPDEGNATKSLVINGTDVTSKIKSNQYTISKITSNTTVSVFFKVDDYAFNSIEINGVYYNLSGKTKTAEVTNSPNRYSGYDDIIIPETVEYQGTIYQVTQIGDEAFKASNILSISIPEGITIIGNYAFANCRKLSSVVLPNSVQDIGRNAFTACTKLSSINIPDGVTIIRTLTFSDCSTLKSIKIPDTVTSLESGVFYNCSALESVSLSANLTTIGSTCFYGCKSLTSVVCMAEDVPKVKSSTFENTIIENITLYVPKNSVNKYKSQEPWSKFGKIVSLSGTSQYTLTYKVDDQVYKTYTIEEGETITPEPAPTKEGYTFSGWSDIPQTMPDHDVTVTGSFTINKYKLTYIVDASVYKTYDIEYGSSITPEAEPSKEGYTFSGWSDIPQTMPAQDVTVTGAFTVNKYKLTYVVDNEVYRSYDVEYGATITPEEAPTKENYIFSGWSDIPRTMPAHDVTVTGSFTYAPPKAYTLTYMVDGEVYKTVSYYEGDAITPEAEPTKEGYTFSGWSYIPYTMPAEDLTVTGTFTVNKYTLTYKIDGVVYKSYEIAYGSTITPEEAPWIEGYTFSGWSEIPETMPAHDVEITGSFTQNVKADPDLAINGKGTFIAQLGFIVTLGQPNEFPELFNPYGLSPIEWTSSNPNVATVDANGVLTLLSVGETQIIANFAGNNEYEAGMAEYSLVVIDSGYMMDDNGNVTVIGGDQTGDVTIDASITINGYTYQVTSIAAYAFKDNQNITSLTIPAGITTIGDNAFNGCINLIVINIGKDVQSIGNKAFANIGTAAVRTRSEDASLIVNCYAESVPQAAWDTFENSPIENGILYVEDDLKDSYMATSPWNKFGKVLGFNEPAGIKAIMTDSNDAHIYDIQGNRLDNVRKGVNIIRTKDGKTKKVVLN